MNTKEMTREQISAFADGELDEVQVEGMLAALRGEEARSDWELYHQIGDVLRSDDMAVDLSAGFSSRLTACLEQEPTFIAPAAVTAVEAGRPSRQRVWRNLGAAAAVATVAFVVTMPLMDALQDEPAAGPGLAQVQQTQPMEVVATTAPEGVILRDPRIDDYLHAHQRFSPSLNNSAEYTRSATFSTK